MLKGDVQLSGRVARTEAGIEAEGFRLANEQLTLAAAGRFARRTGFQRELTSTSARRYMTPMS